MNTVKQQETKQHGGARPGAGRKSRYTTETERVVANIPHELTEALLERYGTIGQALEALALSLDQSLVEFIHPDFKPATLSGE